MLNIRVIVLLLVCAPLNAQQPAIEAPWSEQELATAAALRDRALSGTQAMEHVTSLVTEVGPRLAGSSGDAAAVRWALNRMGLLGFSRVRTQDVLVPHWERGTAEVVLLGNPPQPLVAVALGGSVGTPEQGIEAPVLLVDSFEALQALDAKAVSGKIVFINRRMQRQRDGSDYSPTVKGRVQGPSVAGKLGAAALLIRSVGTSDDRIAHTGSLVYAVDAPRIPAFALAHPDADQLERHLQRGKPVRLRVKSTSRELPPTWSANVIGEIPGGERAEEIVLLAAHLDSWDLGQGAQDDGAGVAIVLEAARLLTKLERRPSRMIRVVLYANEEFGLSGAKEYARIVGDEHLKHVIAVEADTGAGPVWQIESRVAESALPAIRIMQEVLQPLSIALGPNDATGGADLGPLRDLGVPVLDLSLDATHYFDVHHTINDTLSKIDAKHLDQSVAAYVAAAYLAATKRGDFGRLAPK